MAFRDYIKQAINIDSIDPINDMRITIEQNPDKPVLFNNVVGSEGHRAAANVCVRENITNHLNLNPNNLKLNVCIQLYTLPLEYYRNH